MQEGKLIHTQTFTEHKDTICDISTVTNHNQRYFASWLCLLFYSSSLLLLLLFPANNKHHDCAVQTPKVHPARALAIICYLTTLYYTGSIIVWDISNPAHVVKLHVFPGNGYFN
jgi:hypothetical protein